VRSVSDLVCASFSAYRSGDRDALEELLSDDFTFTSPVDDHIDRETYFERCWPNHETIDRHEIEKLFVEGNEAFVRYVAHKTDGKRFRNTELFTIEGDKIKAVDVYFGRSL
jgi:ketosteroid isomerase-like protein